MTLEKYRDGGLALIQKIPTPITPVRIEAETRHITLAYFGAKSTVDYIGVVQGVPVCFDAKDVHVDTFSLQNLHAHQMAFMEEFERQGGIAFYLIEYAHRDEIYYVPFREAKIFWDRAASGGRKSFLYEELDRTRAVNGGAGVRVHFLPQLQRDLWEHDGKEENH